MTSPGFLTTPNCVSKLRSHFRPFNPEGEAEAELENLRMRDNQRITKYLVEFNRLAARVQWENTALRRQFYNGPPPGSIAAKPSGKSDITSPGRHMDSS